MRWAADIAGVRRQWIATVPSRSGREGRLGGDEGATNARAATFEPLGADPRRQPGPGLRADGLVERPGRARHRHRQASGDLERFKSFIEARGTETGEWRGEVTDEPSVGTPDVEDAAASRGDSGKAGFRHGSGGGRVAAVAGASAAAATKSSSSPEPAGWRGGRRRILTMDHREVTDSRADPPNHRQTALAVTSPT